MIREEVVREVKNNWWVAILVAVLFYLWHELDAKEEALISAATMNAERVSDAEDATARMAKRLDELEHQQKGRRDGKVTIRIGN